MKALKPETQERLARLYRKAPLAQRLLGGSDEQVTLITEVGATGDVAAIPHLAPFLRGSRTRTAAMSAIAQLMERVDTRNLPKLEELRGFSAPWQDQSGVFSEWLGAKPSVVDEVDDGTDDSIWALGVLSFHWSGYVREKAVQRLVARGEDRVVPFLLLRANDWVPQVRDAAKAGLVELAGKLGADGFGPFLPLVTRLAGTRRDNHDLLLRTIDGLFAGDDGVRALRRASQHPDRYVRRTSYKRAFALEDKLTTEFLETAMRDSDLVVRFLAAKRACALGDEENLRVYLDRLLKDRLAAVRRVAMYAWVDRLPSELARPPFVELLLDKSAGLRDAARFYVKRANGPDFVVWYRDHMTDADAKTRAAAIRGFAEVAEKNDAEEVRAFVRAAEPSVRSAALAGLGKLLPADEVDVFLRTLEDQSPSVSRTARECLERRAVPTSRLRAVLDGGAPAHAKLNAIKLLLGRDRRNLAGILDAGALVDGLAQEWVKDAVRHWIDRYGPRSYAPPRAECEKLENLLKSHRPFLGPLEAELHKVLDTWMKLPRFQGDW